MGSLYSACTAAWSSGSLTGSISVASSALSMPRMPARPLHDPPRDWPIPATTLSPRPCDPHAATRCPSTDPGWSWPTTARPPCRQRRSERRAW